MHLKLQGLVVWVAMATAVGSRLWLGAVCRPERDKTLARLIMTWVYNWALQLPLLISVDGWSAFRQIAHWLEVEYVTQRLHS
jgi:hypothetical protein